VRRACRRWRRRGAQARARNGAERSEAPTSSPNWRARGESREGNGGGRGSALACHAAEGEREKEWRGREVGSRTVGSEWLQAEWSEAAACAHGRGRLANRGGRWGVVDAA
jgi:hypothetical protein